MSAYNNKVPPRMVGGPSDRTELIDHADGVGTLGSGNYSQRAHVTDYARGFARPVVVAFNYATTPSSAAYDIYVSQTDTDPTVSPSTWTKVGGTTNVNGDQVTIQRGAAGGQQFKFICVKEVTPPGVLTQVTVNM